MWQVVVGKTVTSFPGKEYFATIAHSVCQRMLASSASGDFFFLNETFLYKLLSMGILTQRVNFSDVEKSCIPSYIFLIIHIMRSRSFRFSSGTLPSYSPGDLIWFIDIPPSLPRVK